MQGSEEGLFVTVHRNIEDETAKDHFIGVEVDGNPLTEGKDYTVRFGSVHITLTPEYLATLVEGKHTLTILFDDGEAAIDFTIQKNTPAPAEDKPNTGDNNQSLLWLFLMIAALCSGAATLVAASVRRDRR